MTPEAERISERAIRKGINLVDRFGIFEIAAEIVREAVAAERERCTKIAETYGIVDGQHQPCGLHIAKQIRG